MAAGIGFQILTTFAVIAFALCIAVNPCGQSGLLVGGRKRPCKTSPVVHIAVFGMQPADLQKVYRGYVDLSRTMRLELPCKALGQMLFQEVDFSSPEAGINPGGVENNKRNAGEFCAVAIHRHANSNLKNLKD